VLTLFGLEISLENLLTFAGLILTFAGLVFVGLQMRESNRQLKEQSHTRYYDINRELISLGFSHPALFEVLKDAPKVDATLERRYLQLWLNHLCLLDSLNRSGRLDKDLADSFMAEFRDMMLMANMRRQWERSGEFYPASFQKSVNEILSEAGQGRADEGEHEAKP
jgi:hypothetical protein